MKEHTKETGEKMTKKIFIDGSEGTTGLRIYERFEGRDDIELLKIDPDKRKDPEERAKKCFGLEIPLLRDMDRSDRRTHT